MPFPQVGRPRTDGQGEGPRTVLGKTHRDGAGMIVLTRLSGTTFALNADLIERLDSTPDTVVTLVDGKKYVVAEPLAEVVAMVRGYRAEIIAQSTALTGGRGPSERVPHLVPVGEPPSTAESGKDA